MIRKIAVTTAAAVTAVILGATGAGAAAGSYYFDGKETVSPGSGSASADYAADAFGRMSADGSATGGSTGGLFGGTSSSTGTGQARVTDGFDVQPGSYEVRVNFAGARAAERASGNGSARGYVTGTVTLATGFFEPTILGTGQSELGGTPGLVTLTIPITVTSLSHIGVQAELFATATAKGNGNTASAAADTNRVTFSIRRTG